MNTYATTKVRLYLAGALLGITSAAGAATAVLPTATSVLTASTHASTNASADASIVPQQLATQALCLRSQNNAEPQTAEPHIVQAELALTAEQRATGLMMRESLAENSGMLFVYPRTGQRSFWMFRTLIPLDIAFVSSKGEILDIQQMQPCASYWRQRCPTYPAAQPFLYALEVNLGKFAEWGISEGDWVLQEDCESNLEGFEAW